MNLGELYSEIGQLLNDPLNQKWSTDVIKQRANQAQTVVQGYTRALKTTETLTPTANTMAVTLDSSVMDIYRVEITRSNGDIWPIDGITREELDFDFPDWRNWDAGEPKRWWYDGSNQTLNLIPKPDSNSAFSNALQVWEMRKPTDLVLNADIPFDSNNQLVPYHDSIIHYVVSKCWMDDGTPEALAKSKFHRSGNMDKPGAFELEIKRILGEFDNPLIPTRIKYQKQGGRIGSWAPSKSNPLPF